MLETPLKPTQDAVAPEPDEALNTYPSTDFSALNVDMDISQMRLIDAYQQFVVDEPSKIPLAVRLLENPKSPMALPGSISLQGHDYFHVLLNRGISLYDEGFVVGFTMGNCEELKAHHLAIYKTFSKLFFPKSFRFDDLHLKVFDFGVLYGQRVARKNLYQVNFEQYSHLPVGEVRQRFGIDLEQIRLLWQAEQLLLPVT